MNRFKKEELIKHSEAREGLSELEIKRLDREDARKGEINELARKVHAERFPEEYDYMLDSITDAKERKRCVNPMNDEYITKVNAKRAAEGVTPLSSSGLSVSDDTWEIAYKDAEKHLKGKNS